MKMRVAVLGATGVFGRHLIPRLAASGYSVRALVRTPDSASAARACGADVVRADIFDEASLKSGLSGCDVAINLATTLPSPATQTGDYAKNDALRREGTPIWIRACRAAGVVRVIQQSIAMVHAGGGSSWSDEETFHAAADDSIATSAIAAARSMESSVQQSDLDWLILRGALFYGPGTGFDADWFMRARAGTLRLPGDGSDYVSLVHIADMAGATVAALERWPSRSSLIISDNNPAPWRDVLSHVCMLAGAAAPVAGGRSLMPSFRVSNQRARAVLEWAPRYPDYRSGLAG